MSGAQNGNGPDVVKLLDRLDAYQMKRRELLIQELVALEDDLMERGVISRRAVVSNRMRKRN